MRNLTSTHLNKEFGASSTASTTSHLTDDMKDRDVGSFIKHSSEAIISTNPIGAIVVKAFEFESSLARDIQAKDTGKAVQHTIEGAALSTGAFCEVVALFIGGTIAGAAKLGYHLLGHSLINKSPSESIGGAVTFYCYRNTVRNSRSYGVKTYKPYIYPRLILVGSLVLLSDVCDYLTVRLTKCMTG
jgi:hypothetical protein